MFDWRYAISLAYPINDMPPPLVEEILVFALPIEQVVSHPIGFLHFAIYEIFNLVEAQGTFALCVFKVLAQRNDVPTK